MTYLCLSSRGEIDAQALCLMGASVKDTGAIGEFGSGLKYAIAALLRDNVPFEVWSGTRQIDITVKPETFRGESFGVIWIDGKATSITTRTGPKWHVRDAVREIWSNALDEGEASRTDEVPREGRSMFRIGLSREVKNMVDNWSQYFCNEVPHVFACPDGRILSQPTTNYFRRGVWICEDRTAPSIFSYDFRNFDLPESRRVTGYACRPSVTSILLQLTSADIWHKIINHPKANDMAEIDSLRYYTPNSEAIAALRSAFNRDWTHFGHLEAKPRIIEYIKPEHKVFWCDRELYALFKRCELPNINKALDVDDTYQVKPWPIGVEDRVAAETSYLAKHGIDMSKFDMVYAEFHNDQVIAQADTAKKRCIIGDQALEASPLMLRKALIEEWTHLEHGVVDCTVAQQHVYLDLIVKLMEDGQ